MAATMALTLPAYPRAATQARALVDTLLATFGVTRECRDDLSLIVSEACANAVRHGRHAAAIEVRVSVDQHECVIDVGNPDGVLDDGQLDAALPDPLCESGRGLPIIRALADVARFSHDRAGWVVLHLVKRISREPSATF